MPEMNRREFTEALALSALAPLLVPGASPGLLPVPAPVPDEPASLARALAGAIRAQYGDRLSDADLAIITRHIEASLERAAKLRRVALTNGDEPDFVFSAVRTANIG